MSSLVALLRLLQLALSIVVLTACTHEPPNEASAAGTTTNPRVTDAGAPRVAIGPGADRLDVATIIGKSAPPLEVDSWIGSAPLTLEAMRGRVVLVRWFTQGCPYCAESAPSLVTFHDEYAERGLTVVGLYHHKSGQPLVDDSVQALAARFGFRFPIAIDRDWVTLRRWWLDAHPESWTSVSFLVDRRSVVRFVHTGGSYAPGSADAAQMRVWIEELLLERVNQ